MLYTSVYFLMSYITSQAAHRTALLWGSCKNE